MILPLHIANTLHIWNEVFSYNLKKHLFAIGYFMVWSLVLKFKGRGSDVFSNVSYRYSWRGEGGGEVWLIFNV